MDPNIYIMAQQLQFDWSTPNTTPVMTPLDRKVYEQKILTTLKCDVCGDQATQWFDQTSAVNCGSTRCYQLQLRSYNETNDY